MNRDSELIQEYEDISKTNKPKIAPYYGDMFIDVEMEYLMRKELQKRIDDAIEFIDIYTDGINLEAFDCLKLMYKVKEILEGGSNE